MNAFVRESQLTAVDKRTKADTQKKKKKKQARRQAVVKMKGRSLSAGTLINQSVSATAGLGAECAG